MKATNVSGIAPPNQIGKHADTDAMVRDVVRTGVQAPVTGIPNAAQVRQMQAAAASQPVRSSRQQMAEDNVKIADAYNQALGLSPADLAAKEALICQSPAKMERCFPILYIKDILKGGAYHDTGKLTTSHDNPAPIVSLSGDFHPDNIGEMQGGHGDNQGTVRGPDGKPIWGINDFDMAFKGPVYVDLCRQASVLTLLMQEQGIDPAEFPKVMKQFAKGYLEEQAKIAEGGKKNLRNYCGLTADEAIKGSDVEKLLEKKINLETWTKKYSVPGQQKDTYLFNESTKVKPIKDQAALNAGGEAGLADKIADSLKVFNAKHGFTIQTDDKGVLQIAQKLESGGSSYGQPRYYVMVTPKDPIGRPIILEVKQELPPPVSDAAGLSGHLLSSDVGLSGNLKGADAKQVVAEQIAMGGAGGSADPVLGSTNIDGISYLIRERQPEKQSLDDAVALQTPDKCKEFAYMAGQVCARKNATDPATANAIIKWAQGSKALTAALVEFTNDYCPQAVANHAAYVKAHPAAAKAAAPDIGDNDHTS